MKFPEYLLRTRALLLNETLDTSSPRSTMTTTCPPHSYSSYRFTAEMIEVTIRPRPRPSSVHPTKMRADCCRKKNPTPMPMSTPPPMAQELLSFSLLARPPPVPFGSMVVDTYLPVYLTAGASVAAERRGRELTIAYCHGEVPGGRVNSF